MPSVVFWGGRVPNSGIMAKDQKSRVLYLLTNGDGVVLQPGNLPTGNSVT